MDGEENRMKLADANKLDRKSGESGDLRFQPISREFEFWPSNRFVIPTGAYRISCDAALS
jgi:hypothetical protein